MPAPSEVGSSPMLMPELAAHSAETGTLPPPAGGGVGVAVTVGLGAAPPFGWEAWPPGAARPSFGAGIAGGAGGAGGTPRPSLTSTSAAPAGTGLPHSFAARTPPSAFTSALPFRRLPSNAARFGQPAVARPPSSAEANVLTPLTLPRTVSTTLPEAGTPRGRTTATANRPLATPPATVTPTGAALTFTDFTPE